ncbi:histidine phosphatase family protein [Acetobacteraceae bacterium H6797]|nr:histidine phosphatase family protein [Acetobacteraceae bacterium H6797]
MKRRSLIALLAAAPLPGMAQESVPVNAPSLLAAPAALALLREGGLNLYMRHAITDRSQADSGRRGERAGQRNLSAAGEVQASALGAAFRTLGLPLGEVLTSEVFRAQDTAKLAFGEARIHPALIADDYTARDPRVDAAEVSALLAQPPAGGNRVLVGHIVPLGLILGRSLTQTDFPEGSLALFRPEAGRWRFLGVVTAQEIIEAAS